MQKHFKLEDDVEAPKRWWLSEPCGAAGIEISADSFTAGRRLKATASLKIPIRSEGMPLDFTFGAFEMPVVSFRTLELLDKLVSGCFQPFPASIEGYSGNYAVINFLETHKCLDESQSEFIKWTERDHRSDKAGQYRQITKLRINPDSTAGCEIFRLWGWDSAIIISETIKEEFQREKLTGVRFLDV